MTTCYIGTDLLVYYEEGDNSQRVVPDLFVALGVKNQPRMTYQTWNEGKAPDFVLEVASLSTTKHDELAKWGLYQWLGVTEYWRLDPMGTLMDPPLQAWRLVRGRYAPLRPRMVELGIEEIRSEVLGLGVRAALRDQVTMALFRDPQTGQDILTGAEMDRALFKAQERSLEAAAQAREERELRLASEERERQKDARIAELERRLQRQKDFD